MATMNHVQMNGINPGGPMAMTNGANGAAPRNAGEPEPDMKAKLNTQIYDYLLKNEQWDVARALFKSSMALTTTKSGAARRPNGMDDSSMEDSKDDLDSKKPADLPLPDLVGSLASDNSFLLDWFSVFWDIYFAPHKRAPGKTSNPLAMQFMEQTRQQSQIRQQQQNQFLRQPGMQGQMPPGYGNMMRMNQGMPMSSNDLRQRAGANNARMHMTPQQQQQMLMNRQMIQQQMERAGSEVDMNGRPRTPSSGDNAPSPSKRPRLDGPQFPGQAMMANGRFPPSMAGQQVMRPDLNADAHNAQQLLLQHNIDPSSLSHRQLQSFVTQPQSVQERSIRAYANSFPQGRQNMQTMAGQGGPMGQVGEDYYAANQMRAQGPQNGPQNGGNHALQDYQMQLMLLEQQNKKRLLMARQEQDNIRSSDGQPMVNQSGAFAAPNMSPQGSRSGPSPNPNEMKREDGKMGPMGGLPGSPLPDGMPHNRGSPGPMNFNGQNVPMEMIQAQMKGMPEGQIPPSMRPPSSNPFPGGPNGQPIMEQMRAAQQQQQQQQQQPGVRMVNGTNWQQGPPGQAPQVPPGQQQPGQPQPGHAGPPQPGQSGQQAQMGTPQPRNAAMPPPNVPAGNNAGGARPASPSHSAAAGTPQQSNKPNPKKSADSKKKQPKKKNTTTGAAPMESEAAGQTPAPATPMTPQHQNSFNEKKNNPAQATNAPAPPPAAAPAAPVGAAPTDAPAPVMGDFGGVDNPEVQFQNLDFGDLNNDGIFDNLDFSALVQEGEDQSYMPPDFGPYGNFENMEPQPTDV